MSITLKRNNFWFKFVLYLILITFVLSTLLLSVGSLM
ncbi:stressosome-associated protein Prli42 [Paenibacillus larvae]